MHFMCQTETMTFICELLSKFRMPSDDIPLHTELPIMKLMINEGDWHTTTKMDAFHALLFAPATIT